MIQLINKSDSKVLENCDNLKNAVVYKDMLAFYDAYVSFLSLGIENLPNYCVVNNNLYLNGLCLLIKDYSSEFQFETLDLTLDYMKVLYYLIARFSTDGNLPDRQIIVNEFIERKDSSDSNLNKTIAYADKSQTIYEDAKYKFEQQSALIEKKKAKLNGMMLKLVLTLVLGLGISALIIVLGIAKVMNLAVAIIVAIVVLTISITLFIVGKEKRKKIKKAIDDSESLISKMKNNHDTVMQNNKKAADKRDFLKLEIYNYIECFNAIKKMKDDHDREFLKSVASNNMLSYNLKYDIVDTFDNHSEDILKTVQLIDSLKVKSDINSKLSDVYRDIQKKDWLYYSDYVRFSFIEKLISSATQTNVWQIKVNEKFENPFDINVKDIAEQKVSFLKNDKSLFINMPLNRLVKTKIFNECNDLAFASDISVIDAKKLKMNYSNKFYNFDEISKLKNVSYTNNSDLKHTKSVKSELIIDKKLVPELTSINIKLIEAKLKGENSHHSLIKETNEQINQYEDEFDDIFERRESLNETEEDMSDYIEVPFNALYDDGIEIEEVDDYTVKYTVDGKTVIGYKF